MREEEKRQCIICRGKYIVFTGKGRKPRGIKKHRVRPVYAKTCKHECTVKYLDIMNNSRTKEQRKQKIKEIQNANRN